MNGLPLLRFYQPSDPIAWHEGKTVTCESFQSHVAHCQTLLPDKKYVVNLCVGRYPFLVGFSAALLRGQTTLLPPSRAPKVIAEIGKIFPSCYALTEGWQSPGNIETVSLPQPSPSMGPISPIPIIPSNQIAVVAFTSGSTGRPRPYAKTWDSLVAVAQKTRARIMVGNEEKIHLVATVPHQHMYGLETSVMLPIQSGWSVYSGRPFYPEDIRSALLTIPDKRLLVSSPIHLRACVAEQTQFPPLEVTLSATAPLPLALAQKVENCFHTKIIEIYGFVEAGTIATRRTIRSEHWKLLDGLFLTAEEGHSAVTTPYFSRPISIPDAVVVHGPNAFELQGRPANLVNIGGHRASLDDLNDQLTEIEGVIDGVFYLPIAQEGTVARLMAFVVAPNMKSETILTALREKVDPVFLPRPLYLVESLPRNPTGKLPIEALKALAASQEEKRATHSEGDPNAHE